MPCCFGPDLEIIRFLKVLGRLLRVCMCVCVVWCVYLCACVCVRVVCGVYVRVCVCMCVSVLCALFTHATDSWLKTLPGGLTFSRTALRFPCRCRRFRSDFRFRFVTTRFRFGNLRPLPSPPPSSDFGSLRLNSRRTRSSSSFVSFLLLSAEKNK